MATDPTNWHQALACVAGAYARGEQRITTHELLTVHLGVPVNDKNGRRLRLFPDTPAFTSTRWGDCSRRQYGIRCCCTGRIHNRPSR
jgi:hypothetical protein